MPIVLTENEETESGISYQDRTGISYQFPKMYRRLIQPGERFVYYRGRKRHGGQRKPQYYFGVGVTGEVTPDEHFPDRLICEILDYCPFAIAVPFKTRAGDYLESGGQRRGYFQKGCRVITNEDYQRILTSAEVAMPETAVEVRQDQLTSVPSYCGSPQTLRVVEDFALNIAKVWLLKRYSGADIKVQPRNNPGFDILISDETRRRYVEVKGSQRSTPAFFMTHGELRFSREHDGEYLLVIVYGIGLQSGTYSILCHEGQVSEKEFSLQPTQWACEAHHSNRFE